MYSPSLPLPRVCSAAAPFPDNASSRTSAEVRTGHPSRLNQGATQELYFPVKVHSRRDRQLREAGIDLLAAGSEESHAGITDGSDFTKINPKGYVPVLELADRWHAVDQGPAIVQYIADLKPESGLAPKNGNAGTLQAVKWFAAST